MHLSSSALGNRPLKRKTIFNRVPLLNGLLRASGPLALSAAIITSGLVVLTLFRAALSGLYFERLKETPGVLWLFPVGVRMDLILLCYAVFLPTIVLLLVRKSVIHRFRYVLMFWFATFMSFLMYMEIATFSFVEEYDLRPDQKFWEYLKHVHEVATTLLKVYPIQLAVGFIVCGLCYRFFWKTSGALLEDYSDWGWKKRLIAFPIVTLALVMGARSSLAPRPANLSTAAFSENNLANEFALNSAYSSLYAAYRLARHDKNPSTAYGTIPRDEMFERVRKQANLSKESAAAAIPFMHQQASPFAPKRPRNIVIFLQESMGASDVGCLEGPDITPNLCRLRSEGMWFENLYATGTRTVRGIEATVSGFLPTSAPGVVKLAKSKNDFFTAAALLRDKGYATEFIYGGRSNFDEMRSFFQGNGFQSFYDEPTYKDPAFLGTWGVSDEDLVRKANEVFKAHGDQPFFALMLSTSNHLPYEFPDGRVDLYEQPKQTHFNAIKYADYAIGLLFELAKKEAYYKDTLFLVVADHNSHVRGNDLVPIPKFRIPGVLIGPDVPVTEMQMLASQIDLLPTILHFSGLTTEHPMIGRNLMTIPEGTQGRAIMQFASHNAYRVGNDVVILQPDLPPQQFTYAEQKLTPAPLNQDMVRDALAHAHLPWVLYSEQKYRLK